jgi:hypothetical protein
VEVLREMVLVGVGMLTGVGTVIGMVGMVIGMVDMLIGRVLIEVGVLG